MRIGVISESEGLIISLLYYIYTFWQENNFGKLRFVIHLSLIRRKYTRIDAEVRNPCLGDCGLLVPGTGWWKREIL